MRGYEIYEDFCQRDTLSMNVVLSGYLKMARNIAIFNHMQN